MGVGWKLANYGTAVWLLSFVRGDLAVCVIFWFRAKKLGTNRPAA